MKTSDYYVEYHGAKYRERFDSDVWVAVESGPGGASQFPEALEFGSTRGAAWAKLPLRAVTRRWSERVHGLWNDVPVTVFRGGEEGTVLITFVGSPATAKQLGFDGDVHQGWTLTVPEPEVRITDVEVRERPVESA